MSEENQNYQDLKWTLKSFLQFVTSDKLYYAIFLFVVMIVLVKVIGLLFKPLVRRTKRSVQVNLLQRCLQVLVVISIGMKIASLSDAFAGFTSQILMSSSLIVVVLGFIFQEGLSNIVHGFILSVFNPFQLGDRIHITVDGESITGYVQSIDLRHTIVQNVMNSSHVIIPNSKMDLCIIDNNYFDGTSISSNFLDLMVTYESDLEKSIKVVRETIEMHPLVKKAREAKGITDPILVLVRDLADSGIALRASVPTNTVEENFIACSDIRRALIERFKHDPELDFAYPHIHVIENASPEQPAMAENGDPGALSAASKQIRDASGAASAD